MALSSTTKLTMQKLAQDFSLIDCTIEIGESGRNFRGVVADIWIENDHLLTIHVEQLMDLQRINGDVAWVPSALGNAMTYSADENYASLYQEIDGPIHIDTPMGGWSGTILV